MPRIRRVPVLRAAAYGPHPPPLVRRPARTVVRPADFVRMLALAGHRPSTTLRAVRVVIAVRLRPDRPDG